MEKEKTETLEIQDFLSVKHIKWEFSRFNIITGDMGAGKSLCIKLLKFFEDIIPTLLGMPYNDFQRNLNSENYFEFLIVGFKDIFVLSATRKNKSSFKIIYNFSFKDEIFDIIISGDNKDIRIESIYLRNLLAKWNSDLEKRILNEAITPDGFDEIKRYFYADLLKAFGNHFPIATIFIPASRAALAVSSDYTDNYLKSHNNLFRILLQFKSRDQEIINTILKAKIKIDNNFLYLISKDGREVPLSKASSGQQEIIYVLMLLDRLGNFSYSYGKSQSLFIEEPEAHLFPLEQKQTIELIVQMYNILKGNGSPVRVFITTHSPYVLNTINNTLEKSRLLKNVEKIDNIKIKTEIHNKLKDISYPDLSVDDVSAYMIREDGTADTMINTNDEEQYIYSAVIDKIAEAIQIDTEKLLNIDVEIKKNFET